MHAEVIGDPIGHSLSPTIHTHWLELLGMNATFLAVRCRPQDLSDYLAQRRRDSSWRGCSVTMPLKQPIMKLLDACEPGAAAAGAVNCVVPKDGGLLGLNTDLDGIAAALPYDDLRGRKAVVIGAGGAARAAIIALGQREARIVLLARDAAKRDALKRLAACVEAAPIHGAADAVEGAALVVNATPLGMIGSPAMPDAILNGLSRAPGACAFDMVYRPLDTIFLSAARAAGLRTVDGLTMLIGQARRAFHLFFGAEAPPGEEALRARLRESLAAD